MPCILINGLGKWVNLFTQFKTFYWYIEYTVASYYWIVKQLRMHIFEGIGFNYNQNDGWALIDYLGVGYR